MALSVDIRKALGNFHLAVQFDAGDETLALLGASGCGKSVTLKCIAGILTPDVDTSSWTVLPFTTAPPESTCRPSGGRSGTCSSSTLCSPT